MHCFYNFCPVLWAAGLFLAPIVDGFVLPNPCPSSLAKDPLNGYAASSSMIPGPVVERRARGQHSQILQRDFDTTPMPYTAWYAVAGNQWDEQHQLLVKRAWDSAMVLAKQSRASLESLDAEGQKWIAENPDCKKTKKSSNEFNKCFRMYIAKENPAYTQMFGADPENLGMIIRNFGKVIDNIENIDAESRDKQHIYISMSPVVTDKETHENQCDGGTQAFILPTSEVEEIINLPGVKPKDTAWLLNFCPPFFQQSLGRFEEQLHALQHGGDKNALCNLDKLDSTARIMLHEWTHFPWTVNTNFKNKPIDRRGFYEVASFATEYYNANQKLLTKSFSAKNADNYAWMGVYNYFNDLQECQGVHYSGPNETPGGCTDVWPSEKRKLIKSEWNGYPTSNN